MYLKSSEWVKGWRGFEHRWKTASYDTNPLRSSKPLWGGSFVAAAQILVYVGAVNVLILFAIMLVNKKEKLKPIEGLKF